ncbi:N-acetylmuramoyl-L-alanine amidase family protein [Paenibacillus yonginensis]|uniref:N-acetylmuramoyl-L-alanine amidase family protein n=1 Tax=Paenibacillus yonginensis TaxID=1462996 RepID=UPI0009F6EFC5|nr:N-acetylmuramoyl-L-alanine amidase [Paenibacillus yonginensis]
MRLFRFCFIGCLLISITACSINDIKPDESASLVLRQSTASAELGDTNVSPSNTFENNADLVRPKQNTTKETVEKPIICIEAGHQKKANLSLEPNAPGSNKMKEKVSGGTQGVQTKKPEYQLNLEVAKKLESALTGDFDVIMVRETNEVDISNSERAIICNKAQADVMIRLHADGSENSKVKGMTFFYPSIENKYTKSISEESKEIAEVVSGQVVSKTGVKFKGVKSRDNLTGFNWLKVPSILIEMGFMTNKDEDVLLSTSDYQDKIVSGIKLGLIDYYFHK